MKKEITQIDLMKSVRKPLAPKGGAFGNRKSNKKPYKRKDRGNNKLGGF